MATMVPVKPTSGPEIDLFYLKEHGQRVYLRGAHGYRYYGYAVGVRGHSPSDYGSVSSGVLLFVPELDVSDFDTKEIN